MDLALYDPEFGYYARASQRSGRTGDFFTSVDVSPLFGELLEIQLAEMFDLVQTARSRPATGDGRLTTVDLIEAGAGNGRLSADVLRAARRRRDGLFDRVNLHLVDASAAARQDHRSTLGEVGGRLQSSSPHLPESFEGVLIANELLDALPAHQVMMREEGLREVYVDATPGSDGRLVTREAPPSTDELSSYLSRLGVTLEPGWRAEINLRAVEWIREAARRLTRGFIIIVDYGHEGRELYSATHAGGTLTAFSRHQMAGPGAAGEPGWLMHAGEQDITAHVDFTSVRKAAEEEGLVTLGFLDQTYFLLGLLDLGIETEIGGNDAKRRALKTLVMPGGLGSTHKVLIFGRNVGRPGLRGCSFRQRLT